MVSVLKRLIVLFFGVAQLGRCATSVCAWLPAEAAVEHAGARGEAVAVCAVDDRELLIATRETADTPDREERHVVRWSARDGLRPLLFARVQSPVGESLQCLPDGAWRYTVAGGLGGGRWGVQFTEGSGDHSKPRHTFVPLPVTGPNLWLSLKGDEARGLYLVEEGESTHVLEIGAAGTLRRWTLPLRGVTPGWWSAERLPDDRIALVSLEPGSARAIFRLLGESIEEHVLRTGEWRGHIVTALAPDGTMTIAGKRAGGVIVATIDPSQPSATWRELTAPNATGPLPPRIAATAGVVVVAWDAPDGVRARTLSSPLTVSAGPALPFVLAVQDHALVVVSGRDELEIRRFPAAVGGQVALDALRARLCNPAR